MMRLTAIVGVFFCATVGSTALVLAGGHSDNGCGDCHVPHNAAKGGVGPLWNQLATGTLPTFTLYSSTTFNALSPGITQPDGASKLCLGCHDGAYPTVTAAHTFGDTKALTLSESHPISFVYNTAMSVNPALKAPGSLKNPSVAPSGLGGSGTIATDLLDASSKLQCTSCHEIHSNGLTAYYLKWDYFADNGKTMCRTCHNK
ncbi:MAG: cytochrome c3 family protein [Phycisphaerae bacterium]|nr:cytochrome c3 family protein [Phycisphaerae bacterium]